MFSPSFLLNHYSNYPDHKPIKQVSFDTKQFLIYLRYPRFPLIFSLCQFIVMKMRMLHGKLLKKLDSWANRLLTFRLG